MRKMNGRSPPFISVGLFIVICFISYNLWITSSINEDLVNENKKLQTELKLSGFKQDQCEKKAQLLQQSLYELSAKSEKLDKEILNEEQKIGDAQKVLESKQNLIDTLYDDMKKLKHEQSGLKTQLEERDNKILQIQKESSHVINMKNEAEEIISERDGLIKQLKQQLEQTQRQLEMVKSQLGSNMAASNIPKADLAVSGVKSHNTSAVPLKRDPLNLEQEEKVPMIDIPHMEQAAQEKPLSPSAKTFDGIIDKPDVAEDVDGTKNIDGAADDQNEEDREIQKDLGSLADEDAAAEEKDVKRTAYDVDDNVDYDMDLKQLVHKKPPRDEQQELQSIRRLKVQPNALNYVNFGQERIPNNNSYGGLSNKIRNMGRFR